MSHRSVSPGNAPVPSGHDPAPSSHASTYALMTLTTFFWSGAFIAAKLGIYALSPAILTFLRMGIAAVLLLVFLRIRQPVAWRLARSEIRAVLGTAIVGMIGYHMFFFTAMAYTTASKASMINGINPLLTALLAAAFAGEVLTPKKMAMLLLALAGVVYIVAEGDPAALLTLSFNAGDLLMLCGAILWSVYSLLVKKAIPSMGPLKLTAWTCAAAALLMTPWALRDFAVTDALHAGSGPYLAVLYMAVFPTVLGYTIQQMSIGRIGPSRTALFINLVPVISTILAVLFLKESLQAYHFIGAAMILTAVFVYTWNGQGRPATQSMASRKARPKRK